jgi:hypothetical protein
MLEEMYVYFDMPEPAYGIQLVYNDHEYPELAAVVRDGDAGAYSERLSPERCRFGVVNVQPGLQPVAAQPHSVRQ